MMVVDCGGGTVDITTYKIVSVDPLKLAEAKAPCGGVWGSTYVDKAFKRWLKDFLGDWFETIRKTETLVSITLAWERKKAEFPGQDPTQPLRLNFSDLAQYGMTLQDIEVSYPSMSVTNGMVLDDQTTSSLHDPHFMVTLQTALVKSFFKPTLEKIAECLGEIGRDPAMRDLHRVYVVGGFSRCPLLREMVQAALQRPSCRVVQAHEPDIAIVKGAVMFAENATMFNFRKARLTYGSKVWIPVDEKNPEHRRRRAEGKTSVNANGKTCIPGGFDAHIAIGDDIPADGILTRRPYHPMALTDERSTIEIFASRWRNARFVDEDGCFKVGEVSFDLDMTKKTIDGRAYRVELAFGGPELAVKILHQKEER
ncbi:unnamed protein product, partial [Hapterophycus canaliculatus]